MGLRPAPYVTGIVITPACDLENRKVETITYLPVISVLQYLTSACSLRDVVRTTEGQLNAAGISGLIEWKGRHDVAPTDDLDAMLETIQCALAESGFGTKEKDAANRALAGIRILRGIATGASANHSTDNLIELYGKGQYESTLSRIVKNSQSNDIHFLPCDEQPAEWAAVREHSVVLFRYPITAPVEIFECAQDIEVADWQSAAKRIMISWPVARHFEAVRPMKTIRLRPRFLSDLLTRYVSLYTRLGSPDFSRESVTRYVGEILESK